MNKTEIIEGLVKRVVAGDMLAAEQLYERFFGAMFHISFQMTQDKMLSEDILQDCFTKSFIKINQLKIDSQYGGWLKRMVINASIDAVKKRKNWVDFDQEILNEVSIGYQNTNWSKIEGLDIDSVNQAIAELPERSRLVCCLFLIEGNTHKEISEILEISISTSKSQYQYALKLLRRKLVQKGN